MRSGKLSLLLLLAPCAFWAAGCSSKASSISTSQSASSESSAPSGLLVVVNSASYATSVAPGSLATVFPTAGDSPFTDNPPKSAGSSLSTSLNSVQVAINGEPAPLLYVGAKQINFLVPSDAPAGPCLIEVTSDQGLAIADRFTLATIAPGIYTATGDGTGVAAAEAYDAGGYDPTFDSTLTPVPVNIDFNGNQNLLILYGTGLRSADQSAVKVTVGGTEAHVTYSGPQGIDPGLDQINVLLPETLSFQVPTLLPVQVTVGGAVANPVKIELAATPAHSIADLQFCISETNNPLCALATGSYPVSSTITVSRAALTIDGQGSTLQRSGPGDLVRIQIPTPTGSQGLAIQNLIFNNIDVTGASTDQTIMEIDQADTGLWVANPFLNTGPYSVTVSDCTFNHGENVAQQSPASGIVTVANPGLSQRINDLYIHDNHFNWSNVGFFGNSPYGPARVCDALVDYADSQVPYEPRNIRIEHNVFNNGSEGALAVNEGRWVGIRDNQFTNDAAAHPTGNQAGGEIYLDQCSDTVEVIGNVLFGPPPSTLDLVDGLEMYGRNITVSNNDISGFCYEGILAANVFNLTILDNDVHDNAWCGDTGGIQIHTDLSIGAPYYSRQANGILISGNTSHNTGTTQKHGLRFTYVPPSVAPPPENIVIDGTNSFTGGVCADAEFFPLSGSPPNPVGITSTLAWSQCP